MDPPTGPTEENNLKFDAINVQDPDAQCQFFLRSFIFALKVSQRSAHAPPLSLRSRNPFPSETCVHPGALFNLYTKSLFFPSG